MRTFILKTIIITLVIYILFQLTFGRIISNISTEIKAFSNHHKRIEIKQKILSEMKKATDKKNFFSNEEKKILSNFINKIINELKIDSYEK